MKKEKGKMGRPRKRPYKQVRLSTKVKEVTLKRLKRDSECEGVTIGDLIDNEFGGK